MAVPYTFGAATASIPLSNLDSNFATTITLGNTAIQLGNTVTTLNNMTLANVTVSSGSVTLTNIAVTTANVTTANITTAVIGTATITTAGITTANVATANISGTTTLTGLTASTALALDASKNIASVTNTGTGNNVLATSPTITTPTISSLTSAAATALTLQSAGTTAVTVDTSQNVGIGTTSPVRKLTVSFPGAAEFVLQDTSQAANSRNWRVYNASNSLVMGTLNDAGTAGNDYLKIDSSGNVGIGTSSPSGKLDVRGAAYFGTPNTFIIGDDGGANGAFFNETASVPMRFLTAGTERMRIDSSGNLLVGTTSQFTGYTTNTRLTVSMPSGSSGTTWEHADSSGASAPALFNFLNNSNTRVGYIASSGTATVFSTVSDYRLKEEIAPMTGALAKVSALKPVTYKWKLDGSDGEGFIAHELAEICPHAVTGAKDAVDLDGNPIHQGIDLSFLVATLTAAIQELTARVVALEAK